MTARRMVQLEGRRKIAYTEANIISRSVNDLPPL